VRPSDSIHSSTVTRIRIMCDTKLCTGCRACEVVCSLYHEGVASPALSRIMITVWEYEAWRTEANVCQQCGTPECLPACRNNAICIDQRTGAVVINETECSGCQACMQACSFTPSRIRFNAAKVVCVKCDLCSGNPQCVGSCHQGALTSERVQV
jgi:Fe-S-cluster-containing dehydrogenase component